MKMKLDYIRLMFDDFSACAERNIELTKSENNYWQGGRWMNKNHGKYALKRKITALRQELLNLERMIELE